MANYKELVLLRDEAGVALLAVLPRGVANQGDVALIADDIMLTVEDTEWIDVDSKVFNFIRNTCDIVEIRTLFQTVWEKEEIVNADT
jgi:hypothetical protein